MKQLLHRLLPALTLTILVATPRATYAVPTLETKAARHAKKTTSKPAQQEKTPEQKDSSWWSSIKRGTKKMLENKTIKDMTQDELEVTYKKYVDAGKRESALKCLELMTPRRYDEEGDLYLALDRHIKAGERYDEFVKLYPGHERAQECSLKAIQCSFAQSLDHERDQTMTHKTIELAQDYLKRDTFTAHRDEVKKILAECQQKLLDAEIGVFRFYVKQGRFLSATKRLQGIRKDFKEIIATLEPQALMLETELALAQNNLEYAQAKQQELATKFPKFGKTVLAQAGGNKKIKKAIDRF